ncbi:MAG: ribonuclease Z [Candidatus Woesearchaeota archaeon]
MEITILGTAGGMPTKERNVMAVFLKYKAEGLLFDCGEGTQRQMKIAGIPLSKVTRIFITHWHGDHVIGLPGLLFSLGLTIYNFSGTIEIYGPVGTRERLSHLFSAIEGARSINIKVHEVKSGTILETKDFRVECAPLKHSAPTIGYAFIENDKRKMDVKLLKKHNVPIGPLVGKLQEGHVVTVDGKKITPDMVSEVIPGKKVAYIADTVVCTGAQKLAENADIVICEATYTSERTEEAHEYAHMTAQEAAQLASSANAKKLILTHFSARYKNVSELEEDARNIFDNTQAAKDLMKIKL